jgi:hypothetical protein
VAVRLGLGAGPQRPEGCGARGEGGGRHGHGGRGVAGWRRRGRGGERVRRQFSGP